MTAKLNSLTAQVADLLQEAICSGVYPVGTKLPSGKALGQMHGVSQAVIREATERLRSKGLIDSRQGSGCVVKARTEADGFKVLSGMDTDRLELASVFELRLDLEGSAAGLAAVRRTDADLEKLSGILTVLGENLLDLDAGVELDLAFHTAIAGATHNPYYGTLLKYLNLQLRQAVHAARYNAHVNEPLPQTVQREHLAVFEAIRARDANRARAAVMLHLQRAACHLGLDIPGRDRNSGMLEAVTQHRRRDTEAPVR
ncbi:Transcriptional regulator, GntR family [Caballeronia glathei]|jgi:DNA-binding FadR family transcriptional regulator|uniref:GntR family transcriptional regulator n=1 Tax=Caballeronia glathei TaxID=60547 RepID=A0A069PCQ6_9BURK|nr:MULTISPECIES: FadR/GntR family transcriptional regulator [Burkholderiaceae]KDR38405.1 GntR family transcriptional regulator [Caballeronia glathei]TCK35292.1 DNA-binding FadR family transcriptional regulator [Paraburkholderia sp. BL8N3]CDY74235.1 Transcriptional regulator, GntR family [Caballeronia glathei]